MVAMLVEHKTCLTCQAKQMHAGVAQLPRIHPVEVCGIIKICLHDCEDTHYFRHKNAICAKSENCDAIYETKVPENRCTFAP